MQRSNSSRYICSETYSGNDSRDSYIVTDNDPYQLSALEGDSMWSEG
jgi:hypothetical protein